MELADEKLHFDFEKTFNDDHPTVVSSQMPEFQATVPMDTTSEQQNPGEVCKFFLKGSCTKGAACPYKHSKGERAVVCKHWLRGLCKKGEVCEFLHEYDLSKMPEC